MFEATFRIEHDSLYASITEQSDTRVEVWCNNYCDLLHITGDAFEESIREIARDVGIWDSVHKNGELILITEDCLLDHGEGLLEKFLQRNRCLSLPPLTYDHGTLLTRVVSLDEADLTAVYRELNDSYPVTVEAKREIKSVVPDMPLLMLDSTLPDLSEGQHRALRAAVEHGYYEIPRETTTAERASEMGISRRTYEEHLRRAENKLVKNVIEYISP